MKTSASIFYSCFGLLSLLAPSVKAQSLQAGPTARITAQKEYLRLPVKNGAPKRQVTVTAGGQKVRWFSIELAEGPADWYAYLDIRPWKGQPLDIQADSLQAGISFDALLAQASKDQNAGKLYHEQLRGQFHFSPKRGWNNDPNGLCYYNGEYHLFFQHNPYGRGWGNMHWGHAVSKDLVHWKEVGEALYPDTFGTMFSGSAVVDSSNSSGLGKNGKSPMVLFYTAGEQSWTQGSAFSNDGRNFEKLSQPVVQKISDGNRDPKVIWYAPGKHWIMVVYVEEPEQQHSIHFLQSSNLRDWTPASVVKGGKGDDHYLFECPDFFELPVEGGAPGEKKWVLMAANSEYAVGTFDGQTFVPEEERLNGQLGRGYYAAQTVSDEPRHRRVEIGWWQTRTDSADMTFNQSMSIPMELKLVKTAQGLRMTRTPVDELAGLRGRTHRLGATKVSPEKPFTLPENLGGLLEIRTTLIANGSQEASITVRGVAIRVNFEKEEIEVDGLKAHAPLQNGQLDLTLYTDQTGLEIFAAGGQTFIPLPKNLDPANHAVSLGSTGGTSIFDQLVVYELKSAW